VDTETDTLVLRHDNEPEDGPNKPRLDELVAHGLIHLEMMDDDWLWGRIETTDGRTVELSISVQEGNLVFRGEETTSPASS
jgi:hypothetical protein